MNSNEPDRPDPDELLAAINQEESKKLKGKLKVFFGMCAGVGKTYSMLQTARSERLKGTDVVIGYVETHNRKETEYLLEGFEIIPRKRIEYKGTFLEEFDIDAALGRHPEIIIIDELAHSNSPGSRHSKRYQDVLEILDHGITVYTTVNVQHLESKADMVTQITGITIRESFPDDIFENADEIELVDITPEELIERFREGKVYAPEQGNEALQNFFRTGNITALREMSLRLVADRVDQQLRQYMQRKRLPGPWKTGLHLLVLVGTSPYAGKLLRWAKTLSTTMNATLHALYVDQARSLTATEQQQLNKNIHLAKQLGAEFLSTPGQDLVKAILRVAQKENITHIIVGKPRQRNIISLFRLSSFLNRLVRHSGNIDVYILGSDVSTDKNLSSYIKAPSLESGFSQYLFSGLLVAAVAAICFPFTNLIGYQVISFILLFVISILALFMGIGPILMASTMGALLWDYFFIPPAYTMHISDTEDVFMLFMFFFIALLNGVMTFRLRKQENAAIRRESMTKALYHLTKDLSTANGLDKVEEVAVSAVKKTFDLDAFFLLQENNTLITKPNTGSELLFSSSDMSIASWVFLNQKKAGKHTDTLPSSNFTFYPLTGVRIKPGVIAIRKGEQFNGEQENFWDTFMTQISASIEREYLEELAKKAMMLDESDKLYKTLFNSISHELRIPVTSILGAADSLLHGRLDKESTENLNREIFLSAERLNRLIGNLLNMSRLETGRLEVHTDWCDVRDLVNGVLHDLDTELQEFIVETVIQPDMPMVRLDFGLMEQVLHNLIYNATQHAPKESTIRVKFYYDKPVLVLEVMDRGPGFPAEALPEIFNKFYRVAGTKTIGTGLGLSIVKGFVEAHGGNITVENRINGGAKFIIKIPTDIHDENLKNYA